MKRWMFGLLFLFCLTGNDLRGQETRTWTDASGKFSTTASMVVKPEDGLTDDVELIKSNGDQRTVPYDRLDSESKKYVRDTRRAAKRAQKKSENSTERKSANSAARTWNWRGPSQNGISGDKGLLENWNQRKPELLWSAKDLGSGMSSVSIGNEMIYTMGTSNGTELLIALDLKDGKEVWAAEVGSGVSTSTPTVDGDMVFGLGNDGDLVCVNALTGEPIWKRNFGKDFDGKMMSEWGYSESVLVDGDKVICTPGGPKAMIVALNKRTGRTIWKTPMNPGGDRGTDGAGYASPVISRGGGVKQYITFVGRGLISVNAKNGDPLWQYDKIANSTANVPTPIVDGDFVFCSSGYDDGGTALLKLSGRGGKVNWSEVYYFAANQLQNHHGGMIKIGDHVYMGEGHNKGFPTCIEFRSGKRKWPKQRGAGTGSAAIVAADDHLYFRYENGVMALVEANPLNYKVKGTFKIASHHQKSWPHPVIFDKQLFLRDQGELHCYSLK